MSQDLSPRALLETLVGFPTVSDQSNLELIDWVEGYLLHYGVTATRISNAEGTKASIYANIGPEVEGGVILSGHTDVVPVEGQDWGSDPFVVTEKDDKLYGRGTCDMKGFLAVALSAVPAAARGALKRPLQLAFSYDEEVGCLAAPELIKEMANHLPRASAAIIGEPSMMKTVSGHKGTGGYNVHVRGFEVHSSLLHTGVSAIFEATELINWARRMNEECQAKSPSALAVDFNPPFTTLHVGMIQGGTAHNITAKDCRFDLEFRCVPGDPLQSWKERFLAEVATLDAALKSRHPQAGVTATEYFSVPALAPEDNGAAERLVRKLTGDNGNHVVSYATEAGQFQDGGYSAIVCGPGDIAQAHQPNEFIEISQLNAGVAFVHAVVEHLKEDA
ncbi:MAG: acetylornithine deacetylase [Pseudoruegeria sp.]